MGIELKVANMSSPLIRLKRHSLVLIRVENLKWYGPRITHPAKAKPMYRREAQMRKRSMLGAAPFIVRIRTLYVLKKPRYRRRPNHTKRFPVPGNFDKIQILRMLKDSHQA